MMDMKKQIMWNELEDQFITQSLQIRDNILISRVIFVLTYSSFTIMIHGSHIVYIFYKYFARFL